MGLPFGRYTGMGRMSGRPLTSVASTPVNSTTARIAYGITIFWEVEMMMVQMELVKFGTQECGFQQLFCALTGINLRFSTLRHHGWNPHTLPLTTQRSHQKTSISS